MFNNLIESRAKKQSMAGTTVVSAIVHAILISGAVYATLNAGQNDDKAKVEDVKFVDNTPKEEPKPKDEPPPPKEVVASVAPPKGFTVLVAPVDIPDVIPEVDLSKKATDEADFSGKGVAGGTAKGVGSGPPVDMNQPFFEFQVEKPVVPNGGSVPRYPDILRSAGVEGEVLAQFVVDTSGRVEMNSFKVLRSSHDLFVAAVRQALPGMKFIPAEVGGRHVKQLVQQPFAFGIQK
jgi:protein TonB